jgi:peptidyl-prolyl cis-trans isomerase D
MQFKKYKVSVVMISWMQKHKKYLVITIWISGIAFIGAGTVGFGAYDFNKKNSTIAKVAGAEISMLELQQRYSNLVSSYRKFYGDSFTDENAKQAGLDREALNSLLEEYIYMALSKDFGFEVFKGDVVRAILEDSKFFKDGKFDRDTYERLLKSARIKKQDYEDGLEKSLKIEKISKLFDINASSIEVDAFAFEIEDNLEIKVLDSKNISYVVTDKDLKEYWALNKTNFKTEPSVEVELYEVLPNVNSIKDSELDEYYTKNRESFRDKDDKILSFNSVKQKVLSDVLKQKTKENANRKFYEFEKGKLSQTKKVTLKNSDNYFDVEHMKVIFNSAIGKHLKPIAKNDTYMLVKIIKKTSPKIKDFNDARKSIVEALTKSKKNMILVDRARKEYNSFSGKKIGYVKEESKAHIFGLSKKEIDIFLDKLFDAKLSRGYISLGSKVVLYNILDQKLSKVNTNSVALANSLKKGQISRDVLQHISKKYEVIVY